VTAGDDAPTLPRARANAGHSARTETTEVNPRNPLPLRP